MKVPTRFAIHVTLALVSALVFPSAARALDPYEPNDTRELALPIILSAFDTVITSNAELPTTEDRDWFTFTGVEGTWFSVSCFPNQDLDVEISVYQGDTLIETVNSAGKNGYEELNKIPIDSGGDYYICVNRPETGDTTENESTSYYKLSLTWQTDMYELCNYLYPYVIKTYDVIEGKMIPRRETFVVEGANIWNIHDDDCYRFWARKGDYITATCDPMPGLNAALRLRCFATGKTLDVREDNHGTGEDESIVDLLVPETEMYNIIVGDSDNSGFFEKPAGVSETGEDPDSRGYTLFLTFKDAGSFETGTIAGTISDIETGAGLGYAQITALLNDDPEIIFTGSADETGAFSISTGIQEGSFTVIVEKLSYFSDNREVFNVATGDTAAADLALLKNTGQNKTALFEAFTSADYIFGRHTSFQVEDVKNNYDNVIALEYHIDDIMDIASDDEFIAAANASELTFMIDRYRFRSALSTNLTLDDLGVKHGMIESTNNRMPAFDITTSRHYNQEDRTVTLDVTLTPHIDIEKNHRINVVVSEDSLNYRQLDAGGDIDTFYHNNVVRKMITGAFGEPLNDSTVEAGAAIFRSYTFDIPDTYNENNCHIVVFVTEDPGNGIGSVRNAVEIPLVGEDTILVEDEPRAFRIGAPYPNPFNPSTTIEYELPGACRVTCAVYDILGRAVATIEYGHKSAGKHSAVWDGRDSDGNALASGVYFYRLSAGNISHHGKMMLMR